MNFLRKIKAICILPLFALLVSCASTQKCGCTRSLSIVPPTNSFVKILLVNEQGTPFSSGSGVIIDQVNGTNTIIATAKHICQDRSGKDYPNIRILDVHSQKYEGLVLVTAPKHDMCLITSKTKIDFPAVKVAEINPKQGDNAYNIAAPYGIHGDDMALVFHGHYSGKMKISVEEFPLDVYTVPGGGGSSGSPVFNEDWELIGIITRGHALLEHIMLSVGSEYVREGINTIKPKLAELSKIRVLIDALEKSANIPEPPAPNPDSEINE